MQRKFSPGSGEHVDIPDTAQEESPLAQPVHVKFSVILDQCRMTEFNQGTKTAKLNSELPHTVGGSVVRKCTILESKQLRYARIDQRSGSRFVSIRAIIFPGQIR